MLRRAVAVVLIVLVFISLIPLSMKLDRADQADGLRVRQGVMDLSGWRSEQSPRIKLDGEWEFYWGQLLSPEDFGRGGADKPALSSYIGVPSQWNGKTVGGEKLPAHGFATYRMVLKNVPADETYAVKKTNIRFSSAVFANGKKLFEDGRPADNADGYKAGNVPGIGFFSADKGEIELIVQVANFDYANSGIPASLYFGGQAAMLASQQKSKSQELSAFAVLAALTLIYLVTFAATVRHRNGDASLLLLTLTCACYAIFNGLIGERVLLQYIHMPFELMFKVKDICSMACFIFLALFFYRLKKNILSLKFVRGFIGLLTVYIALIVALPIPTYTKVEPLIILAYESLTLWLLLRAAALFLKSEREERMKSFLLFVAMLCFTLHSIDLILFSFSLKESMWLGQLYIVSFNLMLLFLIVMRFFDAYSTVEQMKDQLLQMDKIKDEFLSNTSHELKTPLNAIVNITDTLLKGAEGQMTERQASNLTIVRDSGRRLTYLVNELLDYSKMKYGDIALHKSDIDLKSYVDSVIGLHLFLLGGKPIRILNEIPAQFPPVHADGNRLVQILHNLIGNAVKFTERGNVVVTAGTVGDSAEVRVTDTGAGFAPHLRELLFAPFEQAAAAAPEAAAGTGLGLSITKKLVELHGGEIHADSTPGEGSVFSFTLPLSVGEAAFTAAADEQEPDASMHVAAFGNLGARVGGSRIERILIVDDDYANLQSMINLLKLEGYPFVVAGRGEEALEELAANRDFYLVILDIRMPDMSGYEVLRKIRERYSQFELPVLMLTANNREGEMKTAMDNGANDFVGKPYEAEELMARVRSLTRLKASVQNARDAEIAFLRSQINPHFLYNALNSIAELCVDEPEQAEELTLQLSCYLRSSFDFKQLDSLTTLENELELVGAYVKIEEARFGDRLNVIYEIEAHPDLRIPPLVLQPLVENAIRHGLMASAEGGVVKLSVKQRAAEVIFSVEDNGRGMSEQRLNEVLSPGDGTDRPGIGLWNISQRLKLLYGRSLRIHSEENRGTTVAFEIPAQPAHGRK